VGEKRGEKAMAEQKDLYFDFSKREKDYAIGFLLSSLLQSREKCGICSNQPEYDEDVNIYLAYLLFAISTAAYQKMTHRFVAFYQTDLANLIEKSEDNYTRYFIYRVNADHLLLYSSVFRDFLKKMIEERRISRISEEGLMGDARKYYELATFYNQRIYRKRTAVGDILIKLSRHFDRYCTVLTAVRRDYFHLMEEFSEGKFERRVAELNPREKEALLKEKQDAFLDLYLLWAKDKTNEELVVKLEEVCRQVRVLDPQFQFKCA